MNPHLKQLWAAMRLPENFKKSYKFFCRGLDIRVRKIVQRFSSAGGIWQKLKSMKLFFFPSLPWSAVWQSSRA